MLSLQLVSLAWINMSHKLTQTIPHRLVPIDLMEELMNILKLPAAIEVMHDLGPTYPLKLPSFT